MTHPHLEVGTGPELLSSSQLFTFEGLIEKAVSPGCECVTKTGAGVASRGEGRAGRTATRMGGWEPNTGGWPCPQPPGTGARQWGTFPWEKRSLLAGEAREQDPARPPVDRPCAAERRVCEKVTARWMG